MDYEFREYRAADVVKVDILINGDKVDALSIIVHRSQSQYRAAQWWPRCAEIDPAPDVRRGHPGRHRRNIIARETVKALRKNVLAKCYGGDITRKRKLLEKQKAGKKRMKQIGSAEVPQEAFWHPPGGRLIGRRPDRRNAFYGWSFVYLGVAGTSGKLDWQLRAAAVR